mgnify:FL=1
MYVITVGDIAHARGVHYTTVNGWIRMWGADSDHPFPVPVARVQTATKNGGWFTPSDVDVWVNGLAAAQKRKRQAGRRPVIAMIDPQPLNDALERIRVLRLELAEARTRVSGRVIEWDGDF